MVALKSFGESASWKGFPAHDQAIFWVDDIALQFEACAFEHADRSGVVMPGMRSDEFDPRSEKARSSKARVDSVAKP